MAGGFEYIDQYLNTPLSAQQIAELENRIINDPQFAEQLAFFILTVEVCRDQAHEDKRTRFRAIFDEAGEEKIQPRVRRFWPYLSAAAAIAAIVLSIYLFYQPAPPNRLADEYIQQHLHSFSITMNNVDDSMKIGASLYNEGKLKESQAVFENIVRHDPSDFRATEYAGIVSLRLEQYDKSLRFFHDLENHPGLHANPGKFYRALTLLKRNLPGDAGQAKKLLEEVVYNKLHPHTEAKALLRKL